MKQLFLTFIILTSLSSSLAEAEEISAWKEPSCDFVKQKSHLNPNELVKEFIAKDSHGDFLQQNEWMNKAVFCPGHLPGPDAYTVISGYKIEKSEVASDVATFSVRYEILGTMTSGGENGELNSFLPKKESRLEKFIVQKTPFGWRLKEFAWPMVSTEAALKNSSARKWMPGERDKFLQATGMNK